MRRSVVWLLSLMSCLTLSAVCSADVDEVQLRLLSQFGTPLRWDNVTGGCDWVGGSRPCYDKTLDMHVTRLVPGGSIIVKVRPYEMFRVFNPTGPIGPDAVEIASSQGTSLYVVEHPQISTDGKSLLCSPHSPDPLLFRVERPVSSPCPLDVALFISRRDTLGEIAPYRGPVCVPGPGLRVGRSDQCGWEKFWPLVPHMPVRVSVAGPCRIAVESRLIEPYQDTWLHDYRIQCLLDDADLATIEVGTAPENTKTISARGGTRVVGRLHRGFVEIPPGVHRLTLIPTASILLRLLRQESPDYLFPRANQPPIPAEQVRSVGFSGSLRVPSNKIFGRPLLGRRGLPEPLHQEFLKHRSVGGSWMNPMHLINGPIFQKFSEGGPGDNPFSKGGWEPQPNSRPPSSVRMQTEGGAGWFYARIRKARCFLPE
ncbi:MAG: hypothetical protein AB1646_18210, partial [Thermodesulfobacteriota bacterium]